MAYPVQTRLFSVIISCWLAISGFTQTGGVEFLDATHYFKFGESLVFQVKVQSDTPVDEIFLFIQPEEEETRVVKVQVNSAGEVVYEYDVLNNPIRPFSKINYWYRVSENQGTAGESDVFSFNYDDNRFEWQELKDDRFVVHWTEGDLTFGQTLINIAHDGLKSAQSYLPVEISDSIKIYVYPQYQDLQTALQFTTHQEAAGHASPVSNLILITAPTSPGQILELERQIPHELTHILQYQLTGSNYTRIPLWLLEGSASLAEIYPNSDYQRVLDQAVENNALFPIVMLCSPFPQDTSGAFLAYAQSESFTRYIFQRFGASGIKEIFKAYSDGLSCEEGAKTALGVTLSNLEKGWQQNTLGMNKIIAGLGNLAPYLALFLLALLPFALSAFLRNKP